MKHRVLFLVLIFGIFILAGVSAQTSSTSFVKHQSIPDYRAYSSQDLERYWPILNDFGSSSCEARQDLLLIVPPGGCQPGVVRSDLIADQNVPVFCQIDALKINPLIDISNIRNVRVSGNLPESVVGTGFHPAKATLRKNDFTSSGPLVKNAGYLVFVLKKTEREADLEDFVNFTLGVNFDYDAGKAFGVGSAEFKLKKTRTEEEWKNDRVSQGFWEGRFAVRLNNANSKEADVSIYQGDKVVAKTTIKKGETSRDLSIPGSYCRSSLQIEYTGFTSAQDKVKLEVSGLQGREVFELYAGEKFLNGKCSVKKIELGKDKVTGKVSISCATKNFYLEIGSRDRGSYSLGEGEFSRAVDRDSFFVLDDEGQREELNILLVDTTENVKEIVVLLGETNVIVGSVEDGKIVMNKEYFSKESIETYKRVELGRDSKSDFRFLGNDLIGHIVSLNGKDIKALKKGEGLQDNILGGLLDGEFEEAIEYYLEVSDNYAREKKEIVDGDGVKTFGEEALLRAIDLSRDTGKFAKENELRKKFIEKYPDSEFDSIMRFRLERLSSFDYSDSAKGVKIDNDFKTVRLVSIDGSTKSKGTFVLDDDENLEVELGGRSGEFEGGPSLKDKTGYFIVEELSDDRAKITPYCGGKKELEGIESVEMKKGRFTKVVCGRALQFRESDIKQVASLKITPKTGGTTGTANLSVGVGIEKRAIKLSPEKALERIENLNESIEKWESISNKLGKVVKGLKTACFATSAALTLKSFFTGIDGGSLAREHTMQEVWLDRCKEAKEKGFIEIDGKKKEVSSLDHCFNLAGKRIESEKECREEAIQKVNGIMSELEDDLGEGTLVFGRRVDSLELKKAYLTALREERSGISDSSGLAGYPTAENMEKDNDLARDFSVQDLRDFHYYSLLKKEVSSGCIDVKTVSDKLIDLNSRLSTNIKDRTSAEKTRKSLEDLGSDVSVSVGLGARPGDRIDARGPIFDASFDALHSVLKVGDKELEFPKIEDPAVDRSELLEGVTHAMFVDGKRIFGNVDVFRDGKGDIRTEEEQHKSFIVLGKKGAGKLEAKRVFEIHLRSRAELSRNDIIDDEYPGGLNRFTSEYGILSFVERGANNPIAPGDWNVRYFDSGPDRGFAAIVPFEFNKGYYAKVVSSQNIGDQLPVYDSSGLPRTWWICNVGRDRGIDYDGGDDDCVQVFSGAAAEEYFGLSKNEFSALILESRKALTEANSQRKKEFVTINGKRLEKGVPVSPGSGIACQEFMSAEDCKLLFNVCDPVICPPSRCDYGGAYPVANVVQTGIVGSIMLCLPNAKEGVWIPVCLTGVQAGIDSYLSVLKGHRDCLQENVESGKVVGICDQIYSVYLCEFFWRQVAPIADILLPRLLEMSYRQGVRGGGEYLTVMSAWENTQRSIDFFTQEYAVNSLEAFRARSAEEVGTDFCKAFISGSFPTDFETLVEPDSPPQFSAWFSSTSFSDVTVPASAQYKVFYHIFAGKDAGISYRVYLRNPVRDEFFKTPDSVEVASGFIGRGEFSSETKDFTAPVGYQELCVNVNGKDECGFKQVSTSFGINVLRDKYVEEQIREDEIGSTRECVAGTPSLKAVLGNTNPGSGAEEATLPKIYQRGIVRICASNNPGQSTEPGRYVEVGKCDEPGTKCWLDRKSIDQALTDANNGAREELRKDLDEVVFGRNDLLLPEEASSLLRELEGGIDSARNLIEFENFILSFRKGLKKRIDVRQYLDLSEVLPLQLHKAWLETLIAREGDKRLRFNLVDRNLIEPIIEITARSVVEDSGELGKYFLTKSNGDRSEYYFDQEGFNDILWLVEGKGGMELDLFGPDGDTGLRFKFEKERGGLANIFFTIYKADDELNIVGRGHFSANDGRITIIEDYRSSDRSGGTGTGNVIRSVSAQEDDLPLVIGSEEVSAEETDNYLLLSADNQGRRYITAVDANGNEDRLDIWVDSEGYRLVLRGANDKGLEHMVVNTVKLGERISLVFGKESLLNLGFSQFNTNHLLNLDGRIYPSFDDGIYPSVDDGISASETVEYKLGDGYTVDKRRYVFAVDRNGNEKRLGVYIRHGVVYVNDEIEVGKKFRDLILLYGLNNFKKKRISNFNIEHLVNLDRRGYPSLIYEGAGVIRSLTMEENLGGDVKVTIYLIFQGDENLEDLSKGISLGKIQVEKANGVIVPLKVLTREEDILELKLDEGDIIRFWINLGEDCGPAGSINMGRLNIITEGLDVGFSSESMRENPETRKISTPFIVDNKYRYSVYTSSCNAPRGQVLTLLFKSEVERDVGMGDIIGEGDDDKTDIDKALSEIHGYDMREIIEVLEGALEKGEIQSSVGSDARRALARIVLPRVDQKDKASVVVENINSMIEAQGEDVRFIVASEFLNEEIDFNFVDIDLDVLACGLATVFELGEYYISADWKTISISSVSPEGSVGISCENPDVTRAENGGEGKAIMQVNVEFNTQTELFEGQGLFLKGFSVTKEDENVASKEFDSEEYNFVQGVSTSVSEEDNIAFSVEFRDPCEKRSFSSVDTFYDGKVEEEPLEVAKSIGSTPKTFLYYLTVREGLRSSVSRISCFGDDDEPVDSFELKFEFK